MHKKSYEKLCQMIYSTNQNPYRPYKAHAQTDQDSNRMPSGDYFLESEKSNNEYEQRKYAQQTEQLLEKLLYLIWQLQIEQKKKRTTISKHRKEMLSMQKHIKKLEKKYDDCCERLTILSKQVKKERTSQKNLSKEMKQFERILGDISFLAGLCPASDSLSNILHAWNKKTKRENRYLNKNHIAFIDAEYKEVK